MKRKLFSLFTAAALMVTPIFAAPAGDDFSGGALSGITAVKDGLLVTDTYNKIVWKVTGSDTLSPQSQATRAQSVCMLLAVMNTLEL